MEACVDSVESAINAEKGGAKRVELCANLVEGGITPSVGMLTVVKQVISIPVFVMIRPRGGDFFYSENELEVMKIDVRALKQAGADGFVTGMLNSDGTVDVPRCTELMGLMRPLPVTFHRAIDVSSNIEQALESIISLNCKRILTSGGENTAVEGIPTIRKLIEQADGRIIIMPGGGITDRNIRRVLDETGAREFHGSARVARNSDMQHRAPWVCMGAAFGPDEYVQKTTSCDKVKGLVRTFKQMY